MRWLRRKRKGFTLVETIACCVILAIVTLGAAGTSAHISALKVEARNTVFLSTHNLNVMERLRQMSYSMQSSEELLAHYGPETFGNSNIDTNVYIESAIWDDFRVYNVRLESKMRTYQQVLVSTYTMTNIGGYYQPTSLEDGADTNVTLP